MDKASFIDDENREDLENLFGKKLPTHTKSGECDLDLIYNYHLKNIVENLNNIDILLKK